jgi:secreted Zn-dependent insulinase-like peptidase
MANISPLLGRVFFEAFLHGNVNRDDAEKASNLIARHAMLDGAKAQEQKTPQFVLMVPLTTNKSLLEIPCMDKTEPNTAVEVYLQIGKDSLNDRVLIDLLVHLMHEPLFDQLRTKEQFGYDVHCSARWTFGVMGLSFCVVSSSKSAHEITARLERFLYEFRETLVSMTSQVFLENLIALAETKLESFTSLEDECNHLWYEINEHRYDWEVNRNEVVSLRSITLQKTLSAYDSWLFPPTSKRRFLVVQVLGMHEGHRMSDAHSTHDEISRFVDGQVHKFHETAGNSTWGKIY